VSCAWFVKRISVIADPEGQQQSLLSARDTKFADSMEYGQIRLWIRIRRNLQIW